MKYSAGQYWLLKARQMTCSLSTRDRIIQPQSFHRPSNVGSFFSNENSGEWTPITTSPLSLHFSAQADTRKRAQPIDAVVGPEIDEDDFAAQSRRRQQRGIEPLVRALERSQLGLSGSLTTRKYMKEEIPHA
jgi:hypothetical protein